VAALKKAWRKQAVAWEGVKSSLPPPLTQEAKDSGEVSRGEKMLYSGTDPESYITEYTFVYEDAGFNSRRTGVFLGARFAGPSKSGVPQEHHTLTEEVGFEMLHVLEKIRS